MIYIISGYILITIIVCIFKKVDGYHSFLCGIKEGSQVVVNMFSCLFGFVFVVECLKNCGIMEDMLNLSTHSWIPEIMVQMMVRPLSAGSSMSIMMDIYDKYGVDSFPALFSTFIHASCDTFFYMVTFYFSSVGIIQNKKVIYYGLFTLGISYILITFVMLLFF